ncbi:MAG: hypothetical protein AB1916_03865 [Thermodesulfobacteriota bacterium]
MEDIILAWLEKIVACLECLGRGMYRLCRCAQRIGDALDAYPDRFRAACDGLRSAARRVRRDLDEDLRIAGLAVRRLWRPVRVQAGLAWAELSPRLPRPSNVRLPLVLGGCLFLTFWLELLVLRTIIPQLPPLRAESPAPARGLDPAYLNNVESLLAEFWHFPKPTPGVSPLPAPTALAAHLGDDIRLPAGVAWDGAAHPLLSLLDLGPAARFSGFSRTPQLPAVRLAVRRCEVRRPVDPKAFHPLDKEALLAASGPYLGQVFAMVETAPATPPATATVLAAAPRGLRPALPPRLASRSLGRLSALFESGDHGVHAIGWDPRGGTSYGKFQMSSLMGTVDRFIAFLNVRAPQWGVRLRQAGAADTGGVLGAMPREWKRIAQEDPVRFERLQDSFIHSEYYSPTVLAISAETGLDVDAHPAAMREVLWSTAVLHGPTGGAEIFIEAARRVRDQPARSFSRALLEEVFRERERRISRSGNPKEEVLRRRLELEKDLALTMLTTPGSPLQLSDRL